jgi:cell division protein FtsL
MTTAIIIAIVVALLGIAGTIIAHIQMRKSIQRKTTELEKDLEAEYEAAMNDIKED